MRQDERAPFDRALRAARLAAYPPGEFVEQESFMQATEILTLAGQAGVRADASVLDLCCGVAGPGRLVAAELGCRYLGVDASASAIELARERAAGLGCDFQVATVPPVPPGPFDVVLLLETMLAFAEKEMLLRGVSSALGVGGRFAFTFEEGQPLSPAEQRAMPDADTVWPVPLREMLALLGRCGLGVRWVQSCTGMHLATAEALVAAFRADREAIVARVGVRAFDELVTAHLRWAAWMRSGRVRKYALVAERVG